MQWNKEITFKITIEIDDNSYNIKCVGTDNDGYDIYINGEFMSSEDELPCLSIIEKYIREKIELDNIALEGYDSNYVS